MPVLEGRTAIITGAGRGIGKRLAIAFAGEGARIGLVARTLPELHLTQLEITHAGGASMVAPANVAEAREVEDAIDAVRRRFGPIDILVCAAGIQGPIGPTVSADPGGWAETLRVNLLGVFHCCRAVLPEMIARRSGKIIPLSGGGAAGARPSFSAYAASKAGLVRFTETLAEEVAEHNIQVNAMAPGATYTHMTDLVLAAGEAAGEKAAQEARSARITGGVPPEQQIALALFLVSPRSNHISGKLISVHDDWKRLEHTTMTPDHLTLRRTNK